VQQTPNSGGDSAQAANSPRLPETQTPGAPHGAWGRFWLAVKVVEVRLRFIAILLAVGLFIGYWDTVKNYWDRWTRPGRTVARELGPEQEFFCPMHPNVVRSTYEPHGDVPKCPICGMPLSIRKKGQSEPLPPGVTGRVQWTPERIQLAGIKTVAVDYRPLAKETTTVGYVTFDESRLSRVTSRVSGYVEKLYVDKTYQMVREGDPLAEIYSPELHRAAQELWVTRDDADRELAAGARQRMTLLGASDRDIDEILRSGRATARLVIRSPQAGYVIEKKIVVGSRLETGMTLLEIADLSSVWIEAEVFEKDVGFLAAGQQIEAAVEAYPGQTFPGRIELIYPRLEPGTRTNRVRFVLDNPGVRLRPGMFATVRIHTPLETLEAVRAAMSDRPEVFQVSAGKPHPERRVLAVPERAVVDTGDKQIVYVEREPGSFEGVEVQLGPRVELRDAGQTVDYYPVLKGLQAGDRVAAAGAFLIDAETRLNPAAASSYYGASGGPQGGSRGGTSSGSGPGTPSPSPPKLQEPSQSDLNRVAELPEEDRQLARTQKWCPITGKPLGSMGVPVKIVLRGDQPVLLCCRGCVGKAKREPDQTVKKAAEFRSLQGP
jgi:Cu(I)/Ag(I) efflux system membrane fusion protein